MKAVILAAGRGKRMGKLGEKMPKCMIKYKGKTLINRNLQILMNYGIKNISIVVGYQKEKLISYLRDAPMVNPWAIYAALTVLIVQGLLILWLWAVYLGML